MKRREFLMTVAGTSVWATLPTGCVTKGRKNGTKMCGMKTDRLKMPPYNTTLMGVVKGVMDYYGLDASAPTLFGASGHAFLINIHKELCPSGPYCWKPDGCRPLLTNLGVGVTDLGFYSKESSAEDRKKVESQLRKAIESGTPCALLNNENQLITGYDADGFFTAQPWPGMPDFPPARLSFGTWREFGDSVHASFYIFNKTKPADRKTAVLDGLDYAVDLYANPSHYSMDGYGIGPNAYTNWLNAVEQFGSSHGNWWNATVWSECRQMASQYFGEIQREFPAVARSAAAMVKSYADIADILGRVSDKTMDGGQKATLLKEAQSKEASAVVEVKSLAAALRANKVG